MNNTMALFAPNNLEIVGVKLETGELCKYEFNVQKNAIIFNLIDRNSSVETTNGEMILVDSSGAEWPYSEVENHTLFVKI